jgi:hypothetical protein
VECEGPPGGGLGPGDALGEVRTRGGERLQHPSALGPRVGEVVAPQRWRPLPLAPAIARQLNSMSPAPNSRSIRSRGEFGYSR